MERNDTDCMYFGARAQPILETEIKKSHHIKSRHHLLPSRDILLEANSDELQACFCGTGCDVTLSLSVD